MANRYWVGGAGTWNTTSTTNWSATSGGAGGASVPTAADSVFFNSASDVGPYGVTLTGALACLDLNIAAPAAGTLTFSGIGTMTVAGSLVATGTNVSFGSTGAITFNSAGARTLTSGGLVFSSAAIVFIGSGTAQLLDNFATGSTVTHTQGTLDLNSFTLTGTIFSSSNTNTRVLAFGATGALVLTGSGATVLDLTDTTSWTSTGSRYVRFTYSGATGTRTIVTGTGAAEATALSVFVTAGTDTVTLASNNIVNDIDLTGFAGTFTTNARTVYGNLVADTNTIFPASPNPTTFNATSGTRTITTNGATLPFALRFQQAATTWRFTDNSTIGAAASHLIGLNSGILDFSNTVANIFSMNAGGVLARSIIGTGTTFNLIGNNAGIWISAPTGLTLTDVTLNATYSGNAGTRVMTFGLLAENQVAPNVNITSGSDNVTITGNVNSLNFTGFTGKLNSGARTIYGNLTLNSGMTVTPGTAVTTFAASTANNSITTNGVAMPVGILFDGAGGSWQLQDDFNTATGATTSSVSLTTGNLDINGKTLSATSFNTSGSNVRSLAFNGGTANVTGTGNVWNIASISNLTLSANASTINLTNTSTTARTFVSGDLTYGNLVIGGTTGNSTTTLTGNATLTGTLSSIKTDPHTLQFTAGTTTTMAGFTVTGSAVSPVTLTSPTAAQHNLVLTGGGTINTVDYLNISYSNASPATSTWYAGSNSVDNGNNLGWIWPGGVITNGAFLQLFNF